LIAASIFLDAPIIIIGALFGFAETFLSAIDFLSHSL
jgi:hypothetical protein